MRMPDKWFTGTKFKYREFRAKYLEVKGDPDHIPESYVGYLKKWRRINGDSDVHRPISRG